MPLHVGSGHTGPVTSTFPSPSPISGPARRSAVLEALQRVALLLALSTLPKEVRKQLRTKWSAQTPQVAQALADVIDSMPGLFTALTFTSETLRQLVTEVSEITAIRSFVVDLADKVSDHQLSLKGQLFEKTQIGVTAVQTLLTSPLTPPETRDQLSRIARPLLDLIETRNAGIQAIKLKNGKLRGEGDERVAEVEEKLAATEQELSRALGGSTPPLSSTLTASAPLPNKRSSRSRRSRSRA